MAHIAYDSIEDWKVAVRGSSQVRHYETAKFSEPDRYGTVTAYISDERLNLYVFLGAFATTDQVDFKKNHGWFHS